MRKSTKRFQDSIKKTRAFVEAEFGLGTTSAKITKNPNTALRAVKNLHRTNKLRFSEKKWEKDLKN